MFEQSSLGRALVVAVFCIGVAVNPLPGQETMKKGGAVPIIFVPPPLENATYSVGVYDAKSGKLVRRLCEAAAQSAFTVGLNGLVTSWDGKDDGGNALPPARYAARGYAVGPLQVEGEAILGNDWAGQDESLRVQGVVAIACVPDDEGLAAVLNLSAGQWIVARFKGSDGSLLWQKPVDMRKPVPSGKHATDTLEAKDGDLIVTRGSGERTGYRIADGESHPLPSILAPAENRTVALGKNESVWKIEDAVLSQHSLKGEVLRSLGPKESDPLPVAVAASAKSERLYLLETKDDWQRVRGLAWVETKAENGKPVSTWQTFFERNIRRPDPSTGLDSASAAAAPAPALEVPLAENPLAPGKHESAKLTATVDEKGSYLATADGLRLRRISERSHLRAAKLAQDKATGALSFFQSDGAAWDQFSITGVKQIISFDAGEFEIDAAGEKPNVEKAPEPDL